MPNPDNEFVLHGRKTPIRDKPRNFLTNSLKTSTSKNLSQTQLSSHGLGSSRSILLDSTKCDYDFNPDDGSFSTEGHSWDPSEKSQLSLDLGSLNSSLSKSFNKSVSFSNKLHISKEEDEEERILQDQFEEELQKLIDREVEDAEGGAEQFENQQDLAGQPISRDESAWFTKPPHLTKNTEFPLFESLGAREVTVSSVRRPAGVTGTELAQKRVASDCSLSVYARKFFPVTLGEMPEIMRTITPSLPLESVSDYQRKRRSETKYDNPQLQAVSDYNYLKASQPLLDQTVVATPYQYELAKLKMERLRLEEQRYLTMKRESELERIRGPQPKWYELKTPKFTYEHSKNNTLLKSKNAWQELMDYRSELLSSSQKFQNATL